MAATKISDLPAVSALAGADLFPVVQSAATKKATLTQLAALFGLASGTYTPTLTNTANVAASTAFPSQYVRVGDVVTVSGRVNVDPTAGTTLTTLGISLPIASNFGAIDDCSGTAAANGAASECAAVIGDATGNQAQMQWITTDATNHAMFFHFTYRVIP